MANQYDFGDLVRITGTATNAAGAATDPAVVKASYRVPAGTITTLVYGTDAALVKSATGIYYVDLSITAVGRWHYRFWSTGTGQGSGESFFEVAPSEFD